MRSASQRGVTAAMVALALNASAAHAQSAQSRDAHGVDDTSIPAVSITGDTTLRKTPYDTSALDVVAARRLAGCYAVRVGAWSDPRANGGRIVTPAEIRLDTTHIAHPYPGRPLAVETPGFINPSHFAVPPRWGPVKHDSLQATVVASQTSSVTIFARRHADSTFTAIARYFTDAIATDPFTNRWMWETYPTAPVQLTPHACASAGEHAASNYPASP